MTRPATLPIRLGRLPAGHKLCVGMVAAMLAAGLYLVADGFYLKAKAVVAQLLLERAFDRGLTGASRPKPWSWADTWPVARIDVPRLQESSIVLAGVSGEALAFGPGLLPGAGRPGEPGTTIIAAHRDTHFRYLKDVKTGDAIDLTRADGQTFTYRVTGFRVVTWDRPGIDLNRPASHLALVTCWPFGANVSGPLRYIVEAQLQTRQAALASTGEPPNKK